MKLHGMTIDIFLSGVSFTIRLDAFQVTSGAEGKIQNTSLIQYQASSIQHLGR